jgi:16S rRNA (guanine966-N2)-methyltransferase
MRIVAGKFAGRDLTSPNDHHVRPTAEHVRAALLDTLGARCEARACSTCSPGRARSGSRRSRAAPARATSSRRAPTSLRALKSNVTALKLKARTRIFKRDALPFAAALGPDSYDIAFVGPAVQLADARPPDRDVAGERVRARARGGARAGARDPPGGKRRVFEDTVGPIFRA